MIHAFYLVLEVSSLGFPILEIRILIYFQFSYFLHKLNIFLFLFNRLAADVIYNPSCVPHLIRLLSIFLTRRSSNDDTNKNEECRFSPPVAFIATVIRNVETFDYFLKHAAEAHLTIIDITETNKPHSFLPYMVSTYNRANVRLYKLLSHI